MISSREKLSKRDGWTDMGHFIGPKNGNSTQNEYFSKPITLHNILLRTKMGPIGAHRFQKICTKPWNFESENMTNSCTKPRKKLYSKIFFYIIKNYIYMLTSEVHFSAMKKALWLSFWRSAFWGQTYVKIQEMSPLTALII